MSNVTRIPDPPQLKVLGCFLSQLDRKSVV